MKFRIVLRHYRGGETCAVIDWLSTCSIRLEIMSRSMLPRQPRHFGYLNNPRQNEPSCTPPMRNNLTKVSRFGGSSVYLGAW